MNVGDVVERNAHGPHRAVVLAVAPSGSLIIACSSVARDMPCVTVAPRTREAFSLGWSQHDTRTSHFYPSGLRVVDASDVTPMRIPSPGATPGAPRRAAAPLVLRLRAAVERWVADGVVTDAEVARRLTPDLAPSEGTASTTPTGAKPTSE